MPQAGTATLLFTDLVNSTELLSQAGDERAQLIFRVHHKLLSDAVVAHGGHEVKWLGDGLMVAFPSSSDAVRCAIAMQQSARRPVAGARLGLRAGLHVGEALRDEADYFGTAVVVARRLCERAAAGQIIASALVSGLLAGRQNFSFRDLGALELKGFTAPVPACEVLCERDEPTAILRQMPFVGRTGQMARLEHKLADVRAGHGALAMLVGGPGIGKTRTLEEFAEIARNEHATVLWGRCYEGEWAPPYGPFAEAITEYARAADAEHLRRELGYGGPPLARLVPALRERLPDLGEPEPLAPEEERFRLLDAASQLLIAISQRTPLVLVLDDLHWADRGTIAMLRHVARFIARNRIMMLGAYRDVELDQQHPLADALGALGRETGYERIPLRGLDTGEIGQLLETIAEQDVPEALIKALSTETDGNPFFIRELLLHLVEEGKIFREDGRWTATLAMEELGIPEGAREVIGRRLSRLSSDANSLLAVASAFNGTFRFGLAASVAGLDDAAALRAVDEALAAQLIRSGTEADSYDFTHSLIRHTLYSELNPSRQVRTHRQIAEAMEAAWGARVGEHAAEVAYQYSRSAVLPGAEHGAVHAIAAADKAEAAYAHEEVVGFLKMALALLAPDEAWRPRLLGRLGLALARTANFDEAPRVVQEAGRLIARTEGNPAATGYFAQAVVALHDSGGVRYAWTLANEGLAYAGERRDSAWVTLTVFDVDREDAERPDNPGLRLPSPRRKELFTVYQTLPTGERGDLLWLTPYASRDRILAEFGDRRGALTFRAGEFRKAIPLWETSAADAERNGRLATAVVELASLAQCYVALGEFGAARGLLRKAQAIAARLPAESSSGRLQLLACRDQFQIATDEGWQEALPVVTSMIGRPTAETAWAFAAIRATGARIAARLGQAEQAVALLGTLIAPL